jgi:hypothetical protein
MSQLIKKSLRKQILFSFLLFCISVNLISQNAIGSYTIQKFDLKNSVFRADALPLKESVPMDEGITNSRFVNGVGGVSFDQMAVPGKDLNISSIKLNYNAKAFDGQRLELFVNGRSVKAELPDWQLIPIARYTASPYYSCVTLFGNLENKTIQKQVTDKKGRIINYHPAFDNTLLGIRLLYMDMLLGYNFTSTLPESSKGGYILGEGESAPDIDANQNGAFYLSQYVIKQQNKYMLTFRSYIISDYSRTIDFNIKNDTIVLTGFPYYFCWKFNSDDKDYDINKLARQLSSDYNKIILDLSKAAGGNTPRQWLIDKMISVSKRYEGNYSFYSEGTFVDLLKLKSVDEKKKFLEKYEPGSLFDMIIKTEAYMDRDSVVYLKGLSDDISSGPELFNAANPAVWKATVNTMRYAAFFRYIKNNFPDAWIDFVSQLSGIIPEPVVYSPTIMYDTADKDLAKLIGDKNNK